MCCADDEMSAAERKQKLRLAVRSGRPGSSEGLTEQLIDLTGKLAARRVGCYVSTAEEPNTLPFLSWAQHNLDEVYTPTIEGDEMRWHQYLGDLEPGRFGIGVSSGPEIDVTELDLVIMPALAATAEGCRLGRGGGFFDRAISKVRTSRSKITPAFAAIVFDAELLSNLPSEAHDQIVDFVVTPSRVFGSTSQFGK